MVTRDAIGSEPLVSVVIIFLNEERFIQEAIDGVFAQTYEHWELLLVDDGSIDGSTDIARRCAEQHPGKVRYLEHDGHQNRGMSASRNLGIRHGRGEYIALMDADDVWLPNILEEQLGILKAHPEAAMVYGYLEWWYSWTGKPEDIHRDFVEKKRGVPADTLVLPPTLVTLFLQRKATASPHVLVRRAVVERIGGFEEEFPCAYEDLVFCTKVGLNASVFVSSKCWYRYRQHPDSYHVVGHNNGEYQSAWLPYLTWLQGYLTEQGIKDPEVWQALHTALRPYRHPRLYHLLGLPWQFIRFVARRTLPLPIHRWLRDRWYPVAH